MKLKITMELEIGDLTDEQRAELEDDLNFVSREKFGTEGWPSDEEEEGYTPTVPLLSEQDPEEIMCTLTDALHELETPEAQVEFWAGTEVYARISKIASVDVQRIPENRVYQMLTDAVAAKLTIVVKGEGALDNPDYLGRDPLEAWKAIDAVEEAHVGLEDTGGKEVGSMLILSGLDSDEMIADLGGSWIEAWDKEHPVDG